MAVSRAAKEFAKRNPKRRQKGSVLDAFVDDLKFLKKEGYTYKQMSVYMLQKHRVTVTPANISYYFREKIEEDGKQSS